MSSEKRVDSGSAAEGGQKREYFSSRLAFYLAAVGSAVGFGNVWRFPQLAADYGGGAFLIPYLMALFLIGIPILFLELMLGQYYQTGAVGSFGSLHARLRGVGLSSIFCAFVLVGYYSMLIAWVIHAFFDSFGDDNPWKQEGTTGDSASGYFFNDIIGMSTIGGRPCMRPTRIIGANVGYSALSWLIVFLCLAWGTKWVGRITYFTMGLPVLILFVFLGRALTLPGSEDGVKLYIGEWDLSVLSSQPAVWSEAVSQIFFSLGLTSGIMTAYGSHVDRSEPTFLNSMVVACSNCAFSFVAGFAVFGALGHLAWLQDQEVSSLSYKSFGLVFGTWPVVLGTLPGGIHWIRLLFFTLFLLGVDSQFSMIEALITVFHDSVPLHNVNHMKMVAVMCTISWALGLMYATDAGLFFLDVIDFYINFVFILIGILETFGLGWVTGLESAVERLGRAPVFLFLFGNFGGIVIACGLWFGGFEGSTWAGFVGLAVVYFASLLAAIYFVRRGRGPGLSGKAVLYELYLANLVDFRNKMRPVVGAVPMIWAVLIKHFIPQVLLVLFINLARSKNEAGESNLGHYGEYCAWPYQVLGILCMVVALLLMLVGAAAPKLYEPLYMETEFSEKGGDIDRKETRDDSVDSYEKELDGEKEEGFRDDEEEVEVDGEEDGVLDDVVEA